MKFVRTGLVAVLVAALGFMAPAPAQAAESVTVAGQSRVLDGVNVARLANYLVKYTPAYGATTRTNVYGYEAAVQGGKVTRIANGVGNMAIPADGYVLSGHGTSRTWLATYAKVGATVTSGTTTGSEELLPDLGMRVLRQFSIVTTGGKKLLKFPGVTANVGRGPLEVKGTRASSTATTWTTRQTIFHADGTKTFEATPGVALYYAGDGHSHWHIRDLDAYDLFNGGGQKVRTGEKHGFCFEDNTSYRDWPTNGTNGTPRNPVYTAASGVCGVNQPNATTVTHGLSVGWGDTYPATLPDQAIDITGLPDGVYTARITADQGGWLRETNESNNAASAKIQIQGNTVTLMSTSGGL